MAGLFFKEINVEISKEEMKVMHRINRRIHYTIESDGGYCVGYSIFLAIILLIIFV